MKATVNLDDTLYRRVKIKAAEDGVTVTSIFEQALQRYLSGQGAQESSRQPRDEFAVPTLEGEGGLLPGVDLTDGAALQRLSDADREFDQLR